MRPNSRVTRIIGALLTAAMLAACSGGNPSTSSLPTTQHNFKWSGKVGKLTFRLKLPSKKRQAEIAQLVSRIEAARGLKPNYFPGSATGLVFKLTSINGVTTTPPTPYDFTVTFASSNLSAGPCNVPPNPTPPPTPGPVLTPCVVTGGTGASVSCDVAAGAYTCSIQTSAPAATDGFLIETEQGTTKILSKSTLTLPVTSGNNTPTGTFSLDPVLSKLVWSSGWTNSDPSYVGAGGSSGGGDGQTEPTWDGFKYTCPSAPTTFCDDPLVNGAITAANDSMTLNFDDAAGNTIIPASGDTSPNIPIYVGSAGGEVNVGVLCNNPDVQWLNASGASPVTYSTLAASTPAPGVTPNATLVATPNSFVANGAASSFTSATTKFIGNGNPSGTGYPQVNSPETGANGGHVGGGTDALGNAIADDVWTNSTADSQTGAWLNYDGGGNAPITGATRWNCVATPTTGQGVATSTYYIGYAEGTVSGGLRRAPVPVKLRNR